MDSFLTDLPEDLIIEILSWLSVKKLLQFKCVCKSWYAIITSSDFISKHLKNNYTNDDSDRFLAQYYVCQKGEYALYEFLLDETFGVSSYKKMDWPIYNSFICGPCDGIFYLDCPYYPNHDRALWNPATNDLKTLPPLICKANLPSHICYDHEDCFGFGFDIVTKDYKVVVIKHCRCNASGDKINYPSSAFMYSLSTDSWRYCGDLSNYGCLRNNKCYICLNGVFYWLKSDHELFPIFKVVVSFDMATELSQEIQVPDDEDLACRKSLAVYHDSLDFLSVHQIKNVIHIWTLNEGCWTRKFTMGPISNKLKSPFGIWKNDKFILESFFRRKLNLHDPITQEISDLGYEAGFDICKGIFFYRESLVSLHGRNGCKERGGGKALASIKDSEN